MTGSLGNHLIHQPSPLMLLLLLFLPLLTPPRFLQFLFLFLLLLRLLLLPLLVPPRLFLLLLLLRLLCCFIFQPKALLEVWPLLQLVHVSLAGIHR
jgi:hypothetical protein